MRAVSIIVPTLNEAENIDLLLERIFAVETLCECHLDVIFSDGASTDLTCEHIERWQHTHKVQLIQNPEHTGLSSAVIAAARASQSEFLIVMDADLSHPPEKIPDILAPLLSGEYDMVIGSRYIKGGAVPEWPLTRKISSQLATLPARLLTDVKDPLAGFIGVSRSRLAGIDREVCGFKFGLELLTTSETTLRVKEVPIIFRDRCHGTSKMSIDVILDYFRQLLILSGIDFFPVKFMEMLPIFIAVLLVDCTFLTMLVELACPMAWAHCISFVLASAIGGGVVIAKYLKMHPGASYLHLRKYVPGFMAIILLTLMLRGGVISTINSPESSFTTAAVLMVSLFSLALSYIGNVCYVFSIGKKRIRGHLVHRFYSFGVIAFLILLRFVYLGGVRLLPEEQYFLGGFSGNGLSANLLSDWFPAVIGRIGQLFHLDSVFGYRLGAWLLWFGSAICIFSLARDMYNRSIAFRAFLIFSVLPFAVGTGIFLSRDMATTFFWSSSIYFLYRALVGKIFSAWGWAGLVLGVGIQADARLLPLIAAIVLYLVILRTKQKIATIGPLLGITVILITCIPQLFITPATLGGYPFYQDGWLNSLFGGGLPLGYGLAILLLSPTGFVAGSYAAFLWLRNVDAVASHARLDNWTTRLFILCFFLLPMLLLIVPWLYSDGNILAGSTAWFVLIPSMALTVGTKPVANDLVAKFLSWACWPTIGVLIVLYGSFLHYAAL